MVRRETDLFDDTCTPQTRTLREPCNARETKSDETAPSMVWGRKRRVRMCPVRSVEIWRRARLTTHGRVAGAVRISEADRVVRTAVAQVFTAASPFLVTSQAS